MFASRGEEIGLPMSLGEGIVVGGGSIAEFAVKVGAETIGSGRAGIASSADDVSIVICTVGLLFALCV